MVTGGAGFIGSNFVRHVMGKHPEIEVLVYDALTYAGNLDNLEEVSANPRCSFIRGDICDADDVRAAMRGCDVVLNFAAETHVDRSISDPGRFIQTDVFGAYVLLEAARNLDVQRFIQISSDEVYGERLDSPATEDSPLLPRNPYAASKAGADRLAFSYWATYGLPVVITRCSNNYGPNQHPEKLIPLFTTNAIDDRPLPVYGSGTNVRDWIHVRDHVEALDQLIEATGIDGEVFNIGAETAQTTLQIASHILKALGKRTSLIQHVTDRLGHDRRYWISIDKLRERLGWEPRYAFETGIEDTVRWYASNEAWWRKARDSSFQAYYEEQYADLAEGVPRGERGSRVDGTEPPLGSRAVTT